MKPSSLLAALALCAPALVGCATTHVFPSSRAAQESSAMQVMYLEIVTPDVDATCTTLGQVHGVTFSAPVAELGGARTADLANGGRIGVRAPMHEQERSVVRPYFASDDVEAAVAAAGEAGGEIAHPALEIPGQGTFGIYFQGSNEFGIWKD